MSEIAPEVELANLEESNASRLAALMDPKRPGGIRTLPAGFIEQMQASKSTWSTSPRILRVETPRQAGLRGKSATHHCGHGDGVIVFACVATGLAAGGVVYGLWPLMRSK